MAQEVWARLAGTWRQAKVVYLRSGGVWRKAKQVWFRSGGVWQQVFQACSGFSGAVVGDAIPGTVNPMDIDFTWGVTGPTFGVVFELRDMSDALITQVNANGLILTYNGNPYSQYKAQLRDGDGSLIESQTVDVIVDA